jgi:hypothetical protein
MDEIFSIYLESCTKRKKRKSSKEEDELTTSVLGGSGETTGDFYAPGDYRAPSVLGCTYSRFGKVGKCKKKKIKKRKS